MIYEHFSMRLHNTDTWVFQTGVDALAKFEVGTVSNPAPAAKVQDIDVPGASGRVDFTEQPRVTFDNKTVEIVLQGQASGVNMGTIESLMSSFQGRVVDYTFDDPESVSGFMVGRLTARFDKFKNKIFLSFYSEPYRYGANEYERRLTALDDYETKVNTGLWTFSSHTGGDVFFSDDVRGSFTYHASASGATFTRTKSVPSGNNGKYLAFGLISAIGGEVWFESTDSSGNVVKSKTCAIVSGNTITMHARIDGSYYEWVTRNNVRQYLPTIRCEYIFSTYLPMSDGDPTGAVSMVFPTNVEIQPDVTIVNSMGYIISDGVAAIVPRANYEGKAPRVRLPNVKADFSGSDVLSVFCFVPTHQNSENNVTLKFRKAEVF